MIRIGPKTPLLAADLTERLQLRPAQDAGARFELPNVQDDAVERRREPRAPKELGAWDGARAEPATRERVQTGAERRTDGAGRHDEHPGRYSRGVGHKARIDGGAPEADSKPPAEAPVRSGEGVGVGAALNGGGADDAEGVDLEALTRANRRQDARPPRSEAARRATGEASEGAAARPERAATRGERTRAAVTASAQEPRTEAPRQPQQPQRAPESANVKAGQPTPQHTTNGLPTQPAPPPPSVTPASVAMNAELARLLALTSDGEDTLLPSSRRGGDLELSSLALGAAELRGAHPSLQRVNPAPPARDIAAQIAEALAGMAADAEGDGVIRLDGADVGRFLARVEVSGRDLVVRLMGHDAAAQALLSQRAPEVKAELERAAVVAGGIDVRADADGRGGGERRDARGEREASGVSEPGETRGAARRRRAAPAGATKQTDGRRGGRVDLIA